MTAYEIDIDNLDTDEFTVTFYAAYPAGNGTAMDSTAWQQKSINGQSSGNLKWTTNWGGAEIEGSDSGNNVVWSASTPIPGGVQFGDLYLFGTPSGGTAWAAGTPDSSVDGTKNQVGMKNNSNQDHYLGITCEDKLVAKSNTKIVAGMEMIATITPTYYIGISQPNVIIGQVVNAGSFISKDALLKVTFTSNAPYPVVIKRDVNNQITIQNKDSADVAMISMTQQLSKLHARLSLLESGNGVSLGEDPITLAVAVSIVGLTAGAIYKIITGGITTYTVTVGSVTVTVTTQPAPATKSVNGNVAGPEPVKLIYTGKASSNDVIAGFVAAFKTAGYTATVTHK